jgi:acetyltransferase-like isoleucine patch superfamily enzyme
LSFDFSQCRKHRSHGTGDFAPSDFKRIGKDVVLERGVLVFNPETISLGDNVYIGHNAILKGYHKSEMRIGDHSWIGQACFLHSAGGIEIGSAVGIGPGVKVLTSVHKEGDLSMPIIFNELDFAPVTIGDGCDIGMGAILLPGVVVGEGAIVGAGSVVTKDVEPYSVVAGNPARFLRKRVGPDQGPSGK